MGPQPESDLPETKNPLFPGAEAKPDPIKGGLRVTNFFTYNCLAVSLRKCKLGVCKKIEFMIFNATIQLIVFEVQNRLKGNFTPNACLTYSDPWVVFNMVVLEFFEKTNFCQFWVLGFVGIHWFMVIRVALRSEMLILSFLRFA